MAEVIKLNAERAATEFNVSDSRLRRGLRREGYVVEKGATYTLDQIYRALTGGLDAEKERETKERADKLARERKIAEGLLVRVEESERIIRTVLLPLRQRLLAASSDLAVRCNKTDPEAARAAVGSWADDTMRMIQQSIDGKGIELPDDDGEDQENSIAQKTD